MEQAQQEKVYMERLPLVAMQIRVRTGQYLLRDAEAGPRR